MGYAKVYFFLSILLFSFSCKTLNEGKGGINKSDSTLKSNSMQAVNSCAQLEQTMTSDFYLQVDGTLDAIGHENWNLYTTTGSIGKMSMGGCPMEIDPTIDFSGGATSLTKTEILNYVSNTNASAKVKSGCMLTVELPDNPNDLYTGQWCGCKVDRRGNISCCQQRDAHIFDRCNINMTDSKKQIDLEDVTAFQVTYQAKFQEVRDDLTEFSNNRTPFCLWARCYSNTNVSLILSICPTPFDPNNLTDPNRTHCDYELFKKWNGEYAVEPKFGFYTYDQSCDQALGLLKNLNPALFCSN